MRDSRQDQFFNVFGSLCDFYGVERGAVVVEDQEGVHMCWKPADDELPADVARWAAKVLSEQAGAL